MGGGRDWIDEWGLRGREHRPFLKVDCCRLDCAARCNCTALMTDMGSGQPRVLKLSSFRGESRQDLFNEEVQDSPLNVPHIVQGKGVSFFLSFFSARAFALFSVIRSICRPYTVTGCHQSEHCNLTAELCANLHRMVHSTTRYLETRDGCSVCSCVFESLPLFLSLVLVFS